MIALLAALLPLVQAAGLPLIAGTLSTLSVSAWIGIAVDLLHLEPIIVAEVKALHPVLDKLVTDLAAKVDPQTAGLAAHAAIAALLSAKASDTIPGYAGDGSTQPISNPDK